MAGLDVEALRADTPGCAGLAYLNNAAASLMSQATLDAVRTHLELEARAGAYRAAELASEALAAGYADAAALLGCAVDEVAFTNSTTHGWQAAVAALRLEPGDRVLVGASEWGGSYGALFRLADRTGIVVDAVPSEADGTISLGALAARLDRRTRLVSLTWLSAAGGPLQPAAAVGALTEAAGVSYFLDAAQVVGQIPIDLAAVRCDVLVAPGRKWLRGPRGTGLLHARRAFLDRFEPLMADHFAAPLSGDRPVLRSDARRFEVAETSPALHLGLCAALRQLSAASVDQVGARIAELAGHLRELLCGMRQISVDEVRGPGHGIVTFAVEGAEPKDLLASLRGAGIEITAVPAGYAPLEMRARGRSAVFRASPHAFTREEELRHLSRALGDLS